MLSFESSFTSAYKESQFFLDRKHKTDNTKRAPLQFLKHWTLPGQSYFNGIIIQKKENYMEQLKKIFLCHKL